MKLFKLSSLAFSCLLSVSAMADFAAAVKAHGEKDFASAFNEFKRLAELGDAASQRNLAAMYANGEFVSRDNIEAWAWFAIAAEQSKDIETVRDKIFSRMSDSDKATASVRFNELHQHFGKEAIASKLMPIPDVRVADCSVVVDGDARPVRTVPPRYPSSAAQNGIEAAMCFSFYVLSSGYPGHIKLTSATAYKGDKENTRPDHVKEFVKESTKTIAKWKFTPAATDALKQVPQKFCLDFKLANSATDRSEREKTEILIERFNADETNADTLYELAKKVENNANQWAYAKKEAKANELRATASQLYLRSAINGKAEAQYRTASDLITGNRCEKEPKKGIFWLTVAAQQGHTESQYLLASRLINGDDVQTQPDKGYEWMKAAAEAGHKQAGLEYAVYLSQNGDLAGIEKYLPAEIDDNHILQLELLAQVEARRGNFEKAVEYQTSVVEIASEIGVAVAERQQTLQKLQKREI